MLDLARIQHFQLLQSLNELNNRLQVGVTNQLDQSYHFYQQLQGDNKFHTITHNPFTIYVASMGILEFTWLPHLCLGYGWVPMFLDGGVCLGTLVRASGIFVSVHMFVALISSFDPSLVVFWFLGPWTIAVGLKYCLSMFASYQSDQRAEVSYLRVELDVELSLVLWHRAWSATYDCLEALMSTE